MYLYFMLPRLLRVSSSAMQFLFSLLVSFAALGRVEEGSPKIGAEGT